MALNLIEEQWIPVRTHSGRKCKIAPWQMTEAYETDPIAALAAPRPDFNGALIQFLIALVQTTAAPKDHDEWRRWLQHPPQRETLKERFMSVAYAFNLDGDGPRFMQAPVLDESSARILGIDSLLIDVAANEHFTKPGTVTKLCRDCCAAALFTLQTNAPAGGRGHMTSLRGGGPLTTLIVGSTERIWEIVWINTLLEASLSNLYSTNSRGFKDVECFPWLGSSGTSGPDGRIKSTPMDVHPLQMYWGMPRKVRLEFSHEVAGKCDLCGEDGSLVQELRAKSHGIDYQGAWLHPLSPYTYDKQGNPIARHGNPGGVTYRHWLGLVHPNDYQNAKPALIVIKYWQEHRYKYLEGCRLWAFGYDMVPGQAKARCYYESMMPLISVKEKFHDEYENTIKGMLEAAQQLASDLKRSVKRAIFGRPKGLGRDGQLVWDLAKVAQSDEKDLFESTMDMFWRTTEPEFYQTLTSVKDALEKGINTVEFRQLWHRMLRQDALMIFDEVTTSSAIEDEDPKRIALARNELIKMSNGKKIRNLLNIP